MAGNALVDYAVEHLLSARLTGFCPHSCIYIPFGNLQKVEDFFDPTKYGDVKLKLTGESAVGAVKVLTQQLRTGD